MKQLLLFLSYMTINLFAQATLYTPNGKSFQTVDGNWPSYTEANYIAWVNNTLGSGTLYPNSYAVGSYENGIWEYNCHSFAWNNWQGAARWTSANDIWKLGKPSPYDLYWLNPPDVFFTDYDNPIGIVSYISTTNQSEAAICTYSNNHSARIVGDGTRCISKWGYRAIVNHPPTETPYGSINTYYKINTAYRPIGSGDPTGRNWQTISNALIGIPSGGLVKVLSGTQSLIENITIPSGVKLTLNPSVTMNFSYGKKLSILGTLNANGATFMGNGSPGYWNSIYFYANSSGSVQNSTIKDAQAGIYTTTNANVTVSGCTITNNSLYGLSIIQNSNVIVSNCTISSNGTGINTNSSSITIAGNNVLNNTNYGINANNISNSFYWHHNTMSGNGYAMLLNNASPYIYNNFISANGHGIVITSSLPNFANPSNQWRGYNAITCSATPLFKAQNYSTVYMGYSGSGGYNSIFGSELPDMESVNHSGIYADNNYWGGFSPAIYADGTSWILARTPLGSDPNPGSGCSGSMASSLGKSSYSPTDEGAIAAKYWEAITQGRNGELQKAKELLQSIIGGKFDQKYSPLALLNLYEFSTNDKAGLTNMLSEILNRDKNDLLKPFAIRLLAREAALTNNNKEMVFYNAGLINNYPNSVNELTALYDLLVYYSEVEQDFEKAKGFYSRLKEAYPKEDLTLFAGINLGINLGDLKKEISTEKVPETFYLSDAFPNPFNPTTKIKFSIPKDEFVSLKIYDILGREVAQLVNEIKIAGEYEVTFDASQHSAGVYLYKIETANYTANKKLILMK